VFFALARYRLPIEVVLLVFGAAWLAGWQGRDVTGPAPVAGSKAAAGAAPANGSAPVAGSGAAERHGYARPHGPA
jgi:hypothetical protein